MAFPSRATRQSCTPALLALLLAACGSAPGAGEDSPEAQGEAEAVDSTVVATPARVEVPGSALASIEAGRNHTCALTREGEAYCWGYNADGQLGDGSRESRRSPVAVAGEHRFASIRGGVSHTCGVTPGGKGYCWGWNSSGQLGDGGEERQARPVAVQGDLLFGSISPGQSHTCGLTRSGEAYCWGQGYLGQLGIEPAPQWSPTPVRVQGDHRFVSLEAGDDFTCALAREGEAYCWGASGHGQLGSGVDSISIRPVQVAGGPFRSLTVGASHACGVTREGRAYCWGDNEWGQLGDGTRERRTRPVPARSDLAFTSASAGLGFTCGLLPGGKAVCWGQNVRGQRGDGTSGEDPPAPGARVAGGLPFTSLAAGGWHACGISPDAAAYCWGWNEDGQVGAATPASS